MVGPPVYWNERTFTGIPDPGDGVENWCRHLAAAGDDDHVDTEANDRFDDSVSMELLSDLQAGLLDDRAAARLRRRARIDSGVARQLAALDRVRRDVVTLRVDGDSAGDIPAEVTARIGTALREQPSLVSGATTRPARHRLRIVAAAAGVAAVIAAATLGTATLLRTGSSTAPAASSSPVAHASDGLPVTDEQLLALLHRPTDLGILNDPKRLVSCLGALGYPPSSRVLGAQSLAVRGTPGVLMLLPGDAPGRINAVVVDPNCSSVDTGLLASRAVGDP
jgi:hypothetical protein